MRDSQKQKVYDAEDVAFYGTALVDRLREPDVEASYRAVLNSDWWTWRPVVLRNARADMTSAGGKASPSTVTTSAGRVHRYTVSHELAHVMVHRHHLSDPGHGPAFRAMHVASVSAIFGEPYGKLLAESYEVFGLDIDTAAHTAVPIPPLPIINIDAMSIATAPTGGWRRPS